MNVGYMQACANLFLICDTVEGLRTNPRVDVLQEDREAMGSWAGSQTRLHQGRPMSPITSCQFSLETFGRGHKVSEERNKGPDSSSWNSLAHKVSIYRLIN